MLKDFQRLQYFSWNQADNARAGFIWEIRQSIFMSDLFDDFYLLLMRINERK